MTEFRTFKCDACPATIEGQANKMHVLDQGWASVMVNLDRVDYCPACWKKAQDFLDVMNEPLE